MASDNTAKYATPQRLLRRSFVATDRRISIRLRPAAGLQWKPLDDDLPSAASGSCSLIDETKTCCFCEKDFKSTNSLQTHLRLTKHPGFEEMVTEKFMKSPVYSCSNCPAESIPFTTFGEHKCIISQSKQYKVKQKQIKKNGLPTTCLFCPDFNCGSRAALICHILIIHTRYLDKSCPICHAIFNTKDLKALASHARDVHVPEIIMNYRKMAFDEQNKRSVLKPWICGYPRGLLSWCGAIFDAFEDFFIHIFTKHGKMHKSLLEYPPETVCRPCKTYFGTATEQKMHEKNFHHTNAQRHYLALKKCKIIDNHFDKLRTCLECYQEFETILLLQVHIVATHNTSSWNICGICNRQYCKLNEIVSPALIYCQIIKHEAMHAKQLEMLSQFRRASTQSERSELFDALNMKYFSYIDIIDFKEKTSADLLLRGKLTPLQRKCLSEIGDKNDEIQAKIID